MKPRADQRIHRAPNASSSGAASGGRADGTSASTPSV
jgi:hypothetical protein